MDQLPTLIIYPERIMLFDSPFTPRRRFLRNSAFGAAALLATPGLFAEQLLRTAALMEGPFYPDRLPLDTDNDLLIINDSLTPAVCQISTNALRSGEPLSRSTRPLK